MEYNTSFDTFDSLIVPVDSTGHFGFTLDSTWRYVEARAQAEEMRWFSLVVGIALDTLADTVHVDFVLNKR